jgi:hypothetical protein
MPLCDAAEFWSVGVDLGDEGPPALVENGAELADSARNLRGRSGVGLDTVVLAPTLFDLPSRRSNPSPRLPGRP